MLDFLYLVILCFLGIEIFFRLKFVLYFSSIHQNWLKVFHVIISSKISDHWKEKMVPVYPYMILKNALNLLGILLLITLLFLLLNFLSDSFTAFTLSFKGLFISMIISIFYVKLRLILFHE